MSSHPGHGPQSHRQRLRAVALRLAAAGVEDAQAETELLYSSALGVERRELWQPSLDAPTADQLRCFEDWVAARLRGVPSAYLIGRQGFYGLEFRVDPRVLIPRADSECLVDACLRDLPADDTARIADLGTGSGCLLLSVLHQRPWCTGIGVDRSAGALQVARVNAQALGLTTRVSWFQADWLQGLAPQCLDLVLCNPPYIGVSDPLGPGVAEQEPAIALFAPENDAYGAYRAILSQTPRVLRPGGRIYFEVAAGRARGVAELVAAAGMTTVALERDLGGVERLVVAQA